LYVLNKQSGGHNLDESPGDERWVRLMDFFEKTNSKYVIVDAHIEHDLKELAHDDKTDFRREYGIFEDGIDALIRAGYELLGLISFFTTGEDETRAWTITKGSTAPKAGAAIHSDFETKFIRAEVINWQKLLEAGSRAAARDKGLIRTEGKEYVVADGDVIEFLHG
jgi:ribosome-binding ATPase YchF (GTP1/OBG family)